MVIIKAPILNPKPYRSLKGTLKDPFKRNPIDPLIDPLKEPLRIPLTYFRVFFKGSGPSCGAQADVTQIFLKELRVLGFEGFRI